MVITSLIFKLLSNSITLRRDKSILFSRATITILLISAFIAYNNLSFLFFKDIFSDLWSSCATRNVFHIFIFLMSSVILLLTLFYRKNVGLKEYSSPDRLLFTSLQSSTNPFVLKVGSMYIIALSGDLYDYNSILSFYHSITDIFNYLTNFNFGSGPMHPVIRDTYDLYRSMIDGSVNIVQYVVNTNNILLDYKRSLGFPYVDHLLQLHSNLYLSHTIQRLIGLLIGPFVLILGVNIHCIVELFATLVDCFKKLVNGLVKKCASYYDPIRNVNFKQPYAKTTSSSKNGYSANNGQTNKATCSGNGSDDGDDGKDNNNKKPFSKDISEINITFADILRLLLFIRNRILAERAQPGYTGIYGGNGRTRELVTIHQIVHYAVDHPDQIAYQNLSLSSLLSITTRNNFKRYKRSSIKTHPIHQLFPYYEDLSHSILHDWASYCQENSITTGSWNNYRDISSTFNITVQLIEYLLSLQENKK